MSYFAKYFHFLALLALTALFLCPTEANARRKERSARGIMSSEIIEPDALAAKAAQEPRMKKATAMTTKQSNINSRYREGIDVSHYQGWIDWDQVAGSSRISYVYLKATEGANFLDDTYARNLSEARRVGLSVGSYHFYRPNVSWQEQLRNLTENVKAETQDLVPIIDIESRGKVSEEKFIADLKAFVLQVERHYGKKPLLYSYQNFYNRQQGLWKSRTISANDLENARSSRDQAQATLKSAQDKLRQYRSGNREQDIAQAKASLEQAQAQLAQAELNLQDSTLIAPSDGTLLTRAVEPGTVLNEGGTVFTVSLTRPVWVRAYVDERNLDQAQPGRKVLLYTDGRPDKPYHGQIGFVSPTAEFTPKTVETPDLRTDLVYRLRIVVTDADDALRQGMPVTVQFGNEAGHE